MDVSNQRPKMRRSVSPTGCRATSPGRSTSPPGGLRPRVTLTTFALPWDKKAESGAERTSDGGQSRLWSANLGASMAGSTDGGRPSTAGGVSFGRPSLTGGQTHAPDTITQVLQQSMSQRLKRVESLRRQDRWVLGGSAWAGACAMPGAGSRSVTSTSMRMCWLQMDCC